MNEFIYVIFIFTMVNVKKNTSMAMQRCEGPWRQDDQTAATSVRCSALPPAAARSIEKDNNLHINFAC